MICRSIGVLSFSPTALPDRRNRVGAMALKLQALSEMNCSNLWGRIDQWRIGT